MAKRESSFKNMTLALGVITCVAALALASVYIVTEEPIALSKKAKINDAIRKVIPDFESISDTIIKPDDGPDSIVVHRLLKGNVYAGSAVETYTNKGFSGHFTLMVGFLPDGSINNVEVLEHKETPGLGTKMTTENFKKQFRGIKVFQTNNGALKVKKDGGTIDAITAATISSRAFCDAINRADAINRKGEKQ
jgi:electron transport complex protein RnfG